METSENKVTEKKKRKSYTLLDKFEILKEYDQLKSLTETADKHNIPKSTLSRWLTERSTLEGYKESFVINSTVKRIRITPLDELDHAVYIWFDFSVQKGGIPLPGPLIKGKKLRFVCTT